MKIKGIFFASILAMSAVSGASAQDPVRHLQDLIGARGGDGEYQMEQRGYNWVRTDKSGGDAYSYWRDNRSGRCVTIRTSQGRYASIVSSHDFDCQESNQGGESNVSQGERDKFQTVCGVVADGQSYSYKCEIVDIYEGNQLIKTMLHYPDQKLKLIWHGRNSVTVRVKGLADREARYSTSEGETNFRMDNKTYFFISDKDAARLDVEHFRN